MEKKLIGLALLALAFYALPAPDAVAQTRAIRGKVLDENGNPLKDVQIIIQGMDIRREYKTKTDKKGEYYHGGLPYGRYRVIAKKDGYQPDEVAGLQPPAGGEEEVNFKLRPGSGVLASELSPEELERLKKQAEEAEKARKMIAEVKALFDEGLAAAGQQNYQLAIEKFQKALELDPQQHSIWAHTGDAYSKWADQPGIDSTSRAQHLERSIEAYRKAIELKPDDVAYHQNLSIALGKAGRMDEARAEIDKANQLAPASAAQNFYNLGAMLVNSGRTEEAAAAFQSSIKADPNYAESYFQLGLILIGSNVDEGLKQLKRYTEIGKNQTNVQTARELIAALEKR